MDRRQGFRRNQRLRTADVGALLANGRRTKGSFISIQFRVNALGIARLGLIVPKRHLPRAVDRNRVKRVLREWFRHRQDTLQGSDLLVRVTRPSPDERLILAEIDRLLPAPPAASP